MTTLLQAIILMLLSFAGACLDTLHIMAFTSGALTAGNNAAQPHRVELQASGYTRNQLLYDRPGNDALENKGDHWIFSILSFHIPDSCVTMQNITRVAITQSSTDGWLIESIVTIVRDTLGRYQLLTRDIGANRWVDGDGPNSYRRFVLTRN
jgi:hypothetical protein